MSEKITLSGVPETMLQTVYARAKETKTRGAITDNKAVELIGRLDYDFSMADKDAAMHSGVIARTIVLDKVVKTYLAGHGGAVVVNIACGLDTRCYRMSDYSHWYNLDLPETIAVREKLLPESRKISQITMSAMDDWGGEIKGTSTDVLVIIEGLTMYLSESDVKRIFDVIAARFDRATVLVETMNPMIVKRFKEKSIEASKAKFTWGVKNGAARAAAGFPLCRRAQPVRGHGGICVHLQAARQDSGGQQYLQPHRRAGEKVRRNIHDLEYGLDRSGRFYGAFHGNGDDPHHQAPGDRRAQLSA